MATLNVSNFFTISAKGNTLTGKHGETTDATTTPFAITVTGNVHYIPGQLSTASIVTVFDDDDDVPVDWDYFFLWASYDLYVQIIGSGSNVILKCLAKVPFTLSYDSMLAAANTTAIAGGSEPSLTDIDSIVLGNYSGNTADFLAAFVD